MARTCRVGCGYCSYVDMLDVRKLQVQSQRCKGGGRKLVRSSFGSGGDRRIVTLRQSVNKRDWLLSSTINLSFETTFGFYHTNTYRFTCKSRSLQGNLSTRSSRRAERDGSRNKRAQKGELVHRLPFPMSLADPSGRKGECPSSTSRRRCTSKRGGRW